MRSNLEGGRNTYAPFRAWLKGKAGGAALDADILAGFARISALYGLFGDSLPPVPAGFDPEAPAAADLETPYGTIFAGLKHESDPADPASLVSKLTAAADPLGIPTPIGAFVRGNRSDRDLGFVPPSAQCTRSTAVVRCCTPRHKAAPRLGRCRRGPARWRSRLRRP